MLIGDGTTSGMRMTWFSQQEHRGLLDRIVSSKVPGRSVAVVFIRDREFCTVAGSSASWGDFDVEHVPLFL